MQGRNHRKGYHGDRKRRRSVTTEHADLVTIRAHRIEIARLLVLEGARVDRARRTARARYGTARRSTAGVQTVRICKRFRLSDGGYAPMDLIGCGFIMGGCSLGGPAKDPMQVALAAIDSVCKLEATVQT